MAGDELGGMVTRERLRVSEFIHGGDTQETMLIGELKLGCVV